MVLDLHFPSDPIPLTCVGMFQNYILAIVFVTENRIRSSMGSTNYETLPTQQKGHSKGKRFRHSHGQNVVKVGESGVIAVTSS